MAKNAKAELEKVKGEITAASNKKDELHTRLEKRLNMAQTELEMAKREYGEALMNDDADGLKAARSRSEHAQTDIELTEAQIKLHDQLAFSDSVFNLFYDAITRALDVSDGELIEAVKKGIAIMVPALEAHKENLDLAQNAFTLLMGHAPDSKTGYYEANAYPREREIYSFFARFLENSKRFTE